MLLLSNVAPGLLRRTQLLPLIGMTGSRLSLRHGITSQWPYSFAVWALVLCGALGRIENGYRFGTLALAVGRRYGGVEEARARFVVDAFVRHWKEPLPEVAALLHADWSHNRDSGDGENASYCAGVLNYTHFLAGGSLDLQERYGEVGPLSGRLRADSRQGLPLGLGRIIRRAAQSRDAGRTGRPMVSTRSPGS